MDKLLLVTLLTLQRPGLFGNRIAVGLSCDQHPAVKVVLNYKRTKIRLGMAIVNKIYAVKINSMDNNKIAVINLNLLQDEFKKLCYITQFYYVISPILG